MSNFLTSSIGKKVIMSLSGLFLISFLCVHLALNLLLIFDNSGELFNQGAHYPHRLGDSIDLTKPESTSGGICKEQSGNQCNMGIPQYVYSGFYDSCFLGNPPLQLLVEYQIPVAGNTAVSDHGWRS